MSKSIDLDKVKIYADKTEMKFVKVKETTLENRRGYFRELNALRGIGAQLHKYKGEESATGYLTNVTNTTTEGIKRVKKELHKKQGESMERIFTIHKTLGYAPSNTEYGISSKREIINDKGKKEIIDVHALKRQGKTPIQIVEKIKISDDKKYFKDAYNEVKTKIIDIIQKHRQSVREIKPYDKRGRGFYNDLSFPVIGAKDPKTGRTYSGVHVKPNLFLNAQKLKKNPKLFDGSGRSPARNVKDHYVGIELEFACPLRQQELALKFIEADVADYINLKGDGSIRDYPSGFTPHEINILCTLSEVDTVVRKVCDILVGCGSIVNRSCGTHVHLDMEHRDKDRAWWNLISAQDVLYLMQSEDRRDNSFCRRIKERTKKLESHPDARGDNRYWGINPNAYSKFKTIEIRMHSGILNADKVINWVKLLNRIVDHKTMVKNISKEENDFIQQFDIDDNLANYVKQRIKLFKDKPSLVESA